MKYLKVFTDFAEAMSTIGDAEKGRLFMAMLKYAETSELPDLRGNERFVWPTAKLHIDRAMKENMRLTENGKMGGRPKATITNDNQRKPTESQKDKDKDKDNNTPPYNPPKRFAPPTTDEVRAYCSERGSRVDAQTFVDFYASKGWKVGNQPMKDWQAAVRTWEKREDKPAKSTRAQNHSTRKYTDAEINGIGVDLLEDV